MSLQSALDQKRILIVGGSYAGLNAAIAAREFNYEGSICLICDEPSLPYHRPPLSKAYLKGTQSSQSLTLRSQSFLDDLKIEIKNNSKVVSIDRSAQSVTLGSGDRMQYTHLALTLGARAKMLSMPGLASKNVFTVRAISDVDALRAATVQPMRVVVIGGGFLGLEVAASLIEGRHSVAVVEAQARLLSRAVSPTVSTVLERQHRSAGVDLRLAAGIVKLHTNNGLVSSVELDSGELLSCDLVVLSVGARPNDELAVSAGLTCDNGIVVDEYGRTNDPKIFAAGDCAAHTNSYIGSQRIRLESVQHAIDHGRHIGQCMAGHLEPYRAIPWFWSEQFKNKLQIAGNIVNSDRCIIRSDIKNGKHAIFHFIREKFIGAETINLPAIHMNVRRSLSDNKIMTYEQIIDITPGLIDKCSNKEPQLTPSL